MYHITSYEGEKMEWLELLKYLFLGLLQGFTEPIPVSSSGHVEIAAHFLKMDFTDLTFALLVNSASLLAVIMIYWQDIIRLAKNGISYVTTRNEGAKDDFKFILYLILGTIPAGVLGVLFQDDIEAFFANNIYTIGIALIVTGIALWLIRDLRGRKQDNDLTWKDAIIVGLAQGIALFPGISRSGATIVASMGLGMKQETALRFSFLLYIPVSLGGTILGISDILANERLAELALPYTLAFIASFIASYFALKWFMGIMARGNLKYFSIYCFIVGPLVILFS